MLLPWMERKGGKWKVKSLILMKVFPDASFMHYFYHNMGDREIITQVVKFTASAFKASGTHGVLRTPFLSLSYVIF